MDDSAYITVILPLRLDWEPFYMCSGATRGDRVRVKFAGKEYTAVVDGTGVPLQEGINPEKVLPVISTEPLERVSPEEISLWHFIADYYMCTVGEVYKAAYPSSRISEEKALQRSGERAAARKEKMLAAIEAKRRDIEARIAKKEEELSRTRPGTKKEAALNEAVAALKSRLAQAAVQKDDAGAVPEPDSGPAEIRLSPAQEKALEGIMEVLSSGKPALLHGVTGSGKTEIYLSLAQKTLEEGRNVLYMVPEIAVSRQIEQRIRSVFGDRLLVCHSGESPSRRRDTASAMRKRPYILLGTRSSVLLPHRRLGLVIIDEEHDRSYKQDEPAPRYSGRDTAVQLARMQGAALVLGSATPSLESLYNCRTGRYGRVILEEKYFRGSDAAIEIIDTRAERRKNGMKGDFSLKLISHIRETLEGGGQVMILRARRSYSPAVQCDECGAMPRCPHCNVSLSLHQGAQPRLVCHWCGYSEPFSGTCPSCGGRMHPLGAGTQRIEEEARELFPQARIARLDSDSSSSAGQIIEDFADGRTDILIGTQIVAKGFDFGRLELVAVIQADGLFGQQDFRADERAAQLLVQLRGRCSRRGGKGLFVIQTATPDHPVYSMLDGGEDLTLTRLGERRAFAFPPVTRLIIVQVRDTNPDRAERMANLLGRALAARFRTSPSLTMIPTQGQSICISYPYAPAIDKVSDRYIRHIRIVLRRDSSLSDNKKAIGECIAEFGKEHSWTGHTVIDVDPA
ncbi:MAG: primosomal protein N' [Candidatus Cryptobacteroides sp.]